MAEHAEKERIFTTTHAHPVKRHAAADEHVAKRVRIDERTDFSRWRLKDVDGCQSWHYLEDDAENEKWPQSYADKYFLGLALVSLPYVAIGSSRAQHQVRPMLTRF